MLSRACVSDSMNPQFKVLENSSRLAQQKVNEFVWGSSAQRTSSWSWRVSIECPTWDSSPQTRRNCSWYHFTLFVLEKYSFLNEGISLRLLWKITWPTCTWRKKGVRESLRLVVSNPFKHLQQIRPHLMFNVPWKYLIDQNPLIST